MSVSTDRCEQDAVDDVIEAAQLRLQHSPYRAIRQISCRFNNGVLLLMGRVPTFHHKQLAQTAVAGLVGVNHVDNQIEVS